MKTRKVFFALLITVSTVAFAFGNDGPSMAVVSLKGSQVFKVIYKGNTSGNVKLKIFDRQEKVIHSESLNGKDGFMYPLNFKGLRPGNYTIEVVDDEGSYRETVSYAPAGQLKSIHASRLKQEGKFLLAISKAQNELFQIRIYDQFQRLLYTEQKVVDGDFAQVYKIGNRGERYVFEISDAAGNSKHFVF